MALTFFYDFSSSYSYLSAMRIEEMARSADVDVLWQPFLLGPIFKDAGYDGSPNLVSPDKAAYMWADIGRRAATRGLPFMTPSVFPQRSIAAARAALALSPSERPAFSRAVFLQTFREGADIGDTVTLEHAAAEAGLDAAKVLEGASSPDAKEALFKMVDAARAARVFGAPSFVTEDKTLFWGDDRLADALSWERRGALAEA